METKRLVIMKFVMSVCIIPSKIDFLAKANLKMMGFSTKTINFLWSSRMVRAFSQFSMFTWEFIQEME